MMQSDMRKAFLFVMNLMLLAVGFSGCNYFKPLDGPGMERDSAAIAAMDSAMKAKEKQTNQAEPQPDTVSYHQVAE